MDLKTLRAQHGHGWAWARTGALILFLVTAILLVASLTASRGSTTNAALQTGSGFTLLSLFATKAPPAAAG